MVGATAMRQVKIWVQSSIAARAEIAYWEMTDANKTIRITPPQQLIDSLDFADTFVIGNLEPGRTYGYQVRLNGVVQSVPQALQFRTQALWQWRTDAPDWKLAFGSCVYGNEAAYDRPGRPYGGAPADLNIYSEMAKQRPDLTLWGGDYLYYREADEDSETGLRYRWRYSRGVPEHQSILRTGSHIAIWDDHEYGPNDSNSSYSLKGDALSLFKRYFPNSAHGLPETPGIFGTHRFNDAEFFLLDNRYHSDSYKLQADDKSSLGAAQLRWLQNALLSSASPIKVVVLGSQILNDVNRWESWQRYPKERDTFLKFLVDHKINGVILLTGDRHFTALYKAERAGTYPLHELTCSPVLAGVPSNLDAERANKQIDPGTFVAARNFCTLQFSGTRMDRRITLRSLSNTGTENWVREIKLNDLQTPANK
jgi:alkaline phosphatase D